MELGCGTKCMKYILFVVNFIFFILGAAAFGLGIWALVDKDKMNVLTKIGAVSDFNVTGKLLESAAIVLLAGGAAILIIGFLYLPSRQTPAGDLDVCASTNRMLKYGFLLIVILVIQIAAIGIAAAFKSEVKDELEAFLKKTINSTYQGRLDTDEEFSLGLDYAQVYFHCCGIDSYKNFEGATQWNRTFAPNVEMKVPPSCCKLEDEEAYLDDPKKGKLKDDNCPVNPNKDNSYMNDPCWEKIYDYLNHRIEVVIGIAVGILVAEVVCLVFACCIISVLRKEEKV